MQSGDVGEDEAVLLAVLIATCIADNCPLGLAPGSFALCARNADTAAFATWCDCRTRKPECAARTTALQRFPGCFRLEIRFNCSALRLLLAAINGVGGIIQRQESCR